MSNWINWPPEFTLSQDSEFPTDFPKLHPRRCMGDVSPATEDYNCFAWAAVVNDARWEPDPNGDFYWPDDVPREYTLAAFIEAYRTIGFELCHDGSNEIGFEKIAIYTDLGEPTHAARQLENGTWTTKFGHCEDIVHIGVDCLEGPLYGNLAVYMKRGRR
jgi:hypothetical protein